MTKFSNVNSDQPNPVTTMYGQVRGKKIKLNNINEPISFSKLHVGEEIDSCLPGPFDFNRNNKLDIYSGRENFVNDLKSLITESNEITDESINLFIKKTDNPYITPEQIKSSLVEILSSKENNPFGDNLKEVKIGNQVIYVGETLEKDIDLKKFYSNNGNGSLFNEYLWLYVNSNTKQIDNKSELETLISTYYQMLDENNELSDEKIEEFLNNNKHTQGLKPGHFKEFLIQMLAPDKTPEEREQYYAENKMRIETITNKYNRLNRQTEDKNIIIGKRAVKKFREMFGKPDSTSMEMIIEKEYYEKDPDKSDRIYMVRCKKEDLSLAELVKKYRAANCHEDAILTKDIIQEMYPDKRVYFIVFSDSDGIADTGHIAVMLLDKVEDDNSVDCYQILHCNPTNIDPKLKKMTVIDNWFGGVYKADEWVKMQSELHHSENFEIVYYY